MRLAWSLLAASVLTACDPGGDRLHAPTSPPSPVPPPGTPAPPDPNVAGSLRIMVVTESGACIEGATVRVIRGQGLGRSAIQDQPCSVWGYGDQGAVLKDLTRGLEMTVLISASGFATREMTVIPTSAHEVELVPDRR